MKKFSLLAAILFGIFPSYLINIAVRNAGLGGDSETGIDGGPGADAYLGTTWQ